MEFVFDFFSRFLDVFRGCIADEIVRNLVTMQRDRALLIAGAFATDVYVFDEISYFAAAETRRFETVYYKFQSGKYAVLEPAIQQTLHRSRRYKRFARDEIATDHIGVYIPFEVCFAKIRTPAGAYEQHAPMQSRVAAMRQFIYNYDKAQASAKAPPQVDRWGILEKSVD